MNVKEVQSMQAALVIRNWKLVFDDNVKVLALNAACCVVFIVSQMMTSALF